MIVDVLDAAGLGQRLGQFKSRLFRLETLPVYTVDSDGDNYRRWLAGEAAPTSERFWQWLEVLRARKATGKVSSRVRILSEQLSEYERYACEWGYAYTAAAGEDIRVLHRGEHDIPDVIETDFWVVDHAEVVLMRYDEEGRFDGAEVTTDNLPAFLLTRDTAWAAAEPFDAWWTRHPEMRRASV